jgi:hypothetical protein
MRFSKAVLVVLVLFGTLALFRAPVDPDFGWHYTYGEYIVRHGQLLRTNVFSHTFTDYTWANSYWFAQVIFYLAHRYLGHLVAGLLFAGVLSLAVVGYVRGVVRKTPPVSMLTAVAALVLFMELAGSAVVGRPMYFSTLFLMALTAVLYRGDLDQAGMVRRGIGKLVAVPVLFAVWANMHADFVLGLGMFGVYVAERIVSAIRGGQHLRWQTAALVSAGMLSVAATLVTPYGLGLWQTLLKEAHPYQFSYISEWVPVSTANMYYFVIYCTTLGLVVSALIGARHKLPTWYVVALGVLCIAAVRSQYFLRVVVSIGIPAVIVFWSDPLLSLKRALSPSSVGKAKVGFLLFLLLSTLGVGTIFLQDARQCTNPDYWTTKQRYPKAALDFASTHSITGNVFNYYGWGGYMIWNYPAYKTFVDGRMPSWRQGDKSVFEDYMRVVKAPTQYLPSLAAYTVDWIVYPVDSEFVTVLRSPTSGWREVYSDDIAAIFVENL